MADVNLYRVRFEEKINNGEWLADSKTVLANGSAESAIEKTRKAELAVKWTDDETGKKYRVTRWRLVGVERLMEIDLP